MGNLLAVKLYASNTYGTVAGGIISSETLSRYPSFQAFCANAGWRSTFANGVLARLGKNNYISERTKH